MAEKKKVQERWGVFVVLLLKVRVNKTLFLCAMQLVCAPRHYLVYLKENKVMQDRTGSAAHVMAGNELLALSPLDRTLLVSFHSLEMKHTWKGGILSKIKQITYMETFNFKIPVWTKNYT